MEQLNRQLRSGILPQQLNYTVDNNIIDYSKLQYNSRYHTFEFFANKFPKGFSEDPLFIPIIEHMAEQAKIKNISLLEELNNILNNSIENNVVSDSLQLKKCGFI